MLTITTMRGTVINVDQEVSDNLKLLYSQLPLDLNKYNYIFIIKGLLEKNTNKIIDEKFLSKVEVNGIKYILYINDKQKIYYTIISYDRQLCFLAEDLHEQINY